MLQGLNLPFIDLSAPENGLHLGFTGPATEAGTGASFSDILRLTPERPALPAAPAGIPLPAAGKDLPEVEADAAAPLPEELLNFAWSGTLPTTPLADAPRLPGSPAIESMLQGSRLATTIGGTMAGPLDGEFGAQFGDKPGAQTGAQTGAQFGDELFVTGRRSLQLTLPAGEPAGRPHTVAAPGLAGRATDVTPLSSAPPLPPTTTSSAALSQAAAATAAVPFARQSSGERLATQLTEILPPGDAPERGSPATTLAQSLSALAEDNRADLKSAAPPAPMPAAIRQAAPGSGKVAEEALLTQVAQLHSASANPVAPRGGVESATPPPALPTIATPVQDPAWGDRLGERLMMMADSKTQVAEIRLTPAELGPLRVRISIDDGAASVTFHAQHAATRDALEQALPRLRELLADNGLTLEDSRFADASEQGVAQGKPEQREAGSRAAGRGDQADVAAVTDPAAREPGTRPRREQLLDTFA